MDVLFWNGVDVSHCLQTAHSNSLVPVGHIVPESGNIVCYHNNMSPLLVSIEHCNYTWSFILNVTL